MLRILIVNDIHWNEEAHGTVDAPHALDRLNYVLQNEEYDIVLVGGDMIYADNQTECINHLTDVRNTIEQYIEHDKVVYAVGNHEFDAGNSKSDVINVLGIPSTYYYKVFEDIMIIALDFQFNSDGSDRLQNTGPYYASSDELSWLDQLLANPPDNVRIVILLSHQPWDPIPLTGNKYFESSPENGKVSNSSDVFNVVKKYIDNFEKILVIAGHTHWDKWLSFFNGKMWFIEIGSLSDTWSPDYKRALLIKI